MRHVLRFVIASFIFPIALLAQDEQPLSKPILETSLPSATKEPILKPSEPFFVPAIDFPHYHELLSEQNEFVPGNRYFSPSSLQELEELKVKSRQESYSRHSILTAYVKGELEGEYDINMIIKRTLKLGLGIEYTPGTPLQVISILSKDDILILPLKEDKAVVEDDEDPITEALNEIDEMQEMFQTSNTEDENDWIFRMAKLNILSTCGVLTKLNYDF